MMSDGESCHGARPGTTGQVYQGIVVRAAEMMANPRALRLANWRQRIMDALRRAIELDVIARRVTRTHYQVASSSIDRPGVLYCLVVHEDGYISCDCFAGEHGAPCKHAARVALRIAEAEFAPCLCDLPESPYGLFDGDEYLPGEPRLATLYLGLRRSVEARLQAIAS